jgi:phytoene dehydrogenase-like protein
MASPLDLERTNPAFINADCMHIGLFLSQYLSYRPLPGWGNYRTPVNNLYMCGASTHPGAGVTGGGRASVQVIMEDLGIDFKKVIGQ